MQYPPRFLHPLAGSTSKKVWGPTKVAGTDFRRARVIERLQSEYRWSSIKALLRSALRCGRVQGGWFTRSVFSNRRSSSDSHPRGSITVSVTSHSTLERSFLSER